MSPALRTRRRYLAFQVVSETKILFTDLSIAIWQSILNFLGEFGTSQAEVGIVRNSYNESNQTGLIRCNHLAVENVRAALSLIQRIGDVRVIIEVSGVSGTIKAARTKFFGEKTLEDFT